MKPKFFIKHIILLCLLTMTFSVRAAIPITIEGKAFLFQVAKIKTENNPNANEIFIMHFNKDTYAYETIGQQKIIKGNYTYKVLDHDNEIALISCHEIYEGKKTDYTLLLNGENDKSGLYIYKQTNGSINPQKRLNFSYYTILANL
ncbi:MAG: hypothetical protein Q8R83_06660 [Legionellaceae bacterium]|nr:hypothetical protein [Legionellaceae bacterium]